MTIKRTILLFAGLVLLTAMNHAQTVTDIDGNTYNTVTIGTQIWLKENLKVTHYRNGDTIPNVTDSSTWVNIASGAYCNYDNDTINSITHGRLYNWYSVTDARNICPIGWHIPTDEEWTTLITYLGGSNVAGGKLKEEDTTHWAPPNIGATNETGFTALPAGGRLNVDFSSIRITCYWWSSTESNISNAWFRSLGTYYAYINRFSIVKTRGYSVRCIKDFATDIKEIKYYDKVNIFPNPATNKIYITSTESQDLFIKVYNIIGECLLQKELNSGTNDIDISSLSKGVYIIILTGSDWTEQRKLTKE